MPAVELVIHRAVRDLLQKFLRRRIHPGLIDPGEKAFEWSAIHRTGMGENDVLPIPVCLHLLPDRIHFFFGQLFVREPAEPPLNPIPLVYGVRAADYKEIPAVDMITRAILREDQAREGILDMCGIIHPFDPAVLIPDFPACWAHFMIPVNTEHGRGDL